MLLAVLFTIVKIEKQAKCPLRVEWIKKMWYTYIHTHTHTHTHTHIYVMEYYSVTEITKCAICRNMDGLGGFPGDSDGKDFACSTGDTGSTPGLGKSPQEGNGNPLQYSCLENPMDRDRQILYGISCM